MFNPSYSKNVLMPSVPKSLFFLTIIVIFAYPVFLMNPGFAESVNPSRMSNLVRMENHTVQIRLSVLIFEIDAAEKFASVEISLWFDNFPYNATQIYADIGGNGLIGVKCDYEGLQSYHGESSRQTWFLVGSGEMYPFDSYTTQFELRTESIHFRRGNTTYRVGEDINFTLSYSHAWFHGPNRRSLRDTWLTTDGEHNLPIDLSNVGFVVRIERKSLVPLLQILLPIVLCYYFLGASILISRSDLNARLRVYFSLFLFAPTFFFAIRPFLPYRSSLTIPEFLLTNLVTSSAVFGICSMIPKKPKSKRKKNERMSVADLVAIVGSMLGLVTLWVTVLPRRLEILPGLVLLLVEMSYVYAMVLRELSRKKKFRNLIVQLKRIVHI